MTAEANGGKPGGFKIETAFMIVMAVAQVAYIASSKIGIGEQSQKDILALRLDIKDQFDRQSVLMERMRVQIEGIPDERARVETMRQKLIENTGTLDKHDARIGLTEKAIFELQTTLNGLVRGSAIPLPGRPR